MKKQLLIALLASATILPAAQAASDYVGINVGRVAYKGSIQGTGSAKDNDVGYRVYAGHQITNIWGVEGGYANLGEFELTGGGLTVGVEPRSLHAAVTATFPLGQKFNIFGKAGFSQNRSRFNAPGLRNLKENDTNTLLGIGGSFLLTQQISLVVEWENYSKILDAQGASLKTNVLSTGVRFGF